MISRFWQDADDYHGVLAVHGVYRLAVSPNGCRYVLQKRGIGDGRVMWFVFRWRKLLSKLVADLPPEISAIAASLPENPADVPRPWAHEMQAQGAAVRVSNMTADEYGAVLIAADDARVILGNVKRLYVVQFRDGDRWQYVAGSSSRGGLKRSAGHPIAKRYRGAESARARLLLGAIDGLPEKAADSSAAVPPPLADVVASIRRKA